MPNTPEIPEQNPEGDHVEQLLSQLSPEEIEHLATMLSGDMQDPNAAQGGEDVASLAKAIEAHLGQNPEAAVEGAAPEKMASLHLIKSASYIEGFLNHAISGGVSVKEAVDLYDYSLSDTLNKIKSAELKGNQYKLDVNKNGKIDAADLKALRHEGKESPKHEKSESKKEEKAEHMKEAAYYQGLFERAREYGLSDKQAFALLKSAAGELEDPYANTQASIDALRKQISEGAQQYGNTDPKRYMQLRDSSNAAIEQLQNMLPREGSRLGDPGFIGPDQNQTPLPTVEDAIAEANKHITEGAFPPSTSNQNTTSTAGQDTTSTEGQGDHMQGLAEKLKDMLASGAHAGKDALSSGFSHLKDTASRGAHSLMDYIQNNPEAVKNIGMGAAGAGALGLGAYGLNKLMHRKDKSEELQPKEAAYYEGMFKRAQEYGLSEQQALQLIQATSRNK